VDSGGSKEACILDGGSHWRNLANTIEPSMCGGDVAFCQITLTTCMPEMEGSSGYGSPGYRVGQRFWPGRVGSRVSVSDPVFDPVFSFNMRVYRGVVSAE